MATGAKKKTAENTAFSCMSAITKRENGCKYVKNMRHLYHGDNQTPVKHKVCDVCGAAVRVAAVPKQQTRYERSIRGFWLIFNVGEDLCAGTQ